MALVVNTNMNSLTIENTLSNTNNSVSQSLQKRSSGLRINSAADDPAAVVVALAEWTSGPAEAASTLVAGSVLSAWALVRAVRIAYPDAPTTALGSAFVVGLVSFLPALLARLVV